jgi:hypothetical protein
MAWRVRRYHKRVGFIASERGEGNLYLSAVPRVHDVGLDAEDSSGCLEICDEVRSGRGIRIY